MVRLSRLAARVRSSRPLRVLAVCFLAPVVVFTTPTTAAAAYSSGTATFRMENGLTSPDATCKIAWAQTANGINVGSTSRCDGPPDWSPGYAQPYEYGAGAYGLIAEDTAGGTCGSTGLVQRNPSGNDLRSVATGFESVSFALPVPGCVTTKLCLTYYYKGITQPESMAVDARSCVSVALQVGNQNPPVVIGEEYGDCEYGNVEAGAWAHRSTYADQWGSNLMKDKVNLLWRDRDEKLWAGGSGGSAAAWSEVEREWNITILHQGVGQPDRTPNAWAEYMATDYTSNDNNPHWTTNDTWENEPNGLPGSHNENSSGVPFGVQVTLKKYSTSNIPLGYTNPGLCTFWLGPKIRDQDNPLYGYSDPAGPFGDSGETGPVEPPPDPPVVDDVGDDEGPDTGFGLLDLIWRILRAIATAIADVAKAIAGLVKAILNGLKDLLIPSPGFFRDAVVDARDAWSDTAPVVVADSFIDFGTGMSAPSSSGCEGPSLTIKGYKVGSGGGAPGETTIRPFNACGSMATYAQIARVCLQLTAAVGGMVAGFRILAGAFGANATPGATS